jgi:hypothetical protein
LALSERGAGMAFCGKCGTASVDGNSFCHNCGAALTIQPNSGASVKSVVAAAPAAERKFFEDRQVLVTNARCVISGKTFAMAGITSVGSYAEIPSRKGPIIVIIVGVIIGLLNLSSRNAIGALLIGAILLVIGVLWYKGIKNIYHVVIHSASGEVRPLRDYNPQYIHGIVQAVNDAIVYRN